jgi:hypothetical protein
VALVGVILNVDERGSRVVFGDYTFEGAPAAMRDDYTLANFNSASVSHIYESLLIGDLLRWVSDFS